MQRTYQIGCEQLRAEFCYVTCSYLRGIHFQLIASLHFYFEKIFQCSCQTKKEGKNMIETKNFET